MAWTGLICLNMGTSWARVWTRQWKSGF